MDIITFLLIIATVIILGLIGKHIYDRYFHDKGSVWFIELFSFEEGVSDEERDWFIYGIYKFEREAEEVRGKLEEKITHAILTKDKNPISFENESGKKWTLDELKSFVEWSTKQNIANRIFDVRVREYRLL